MYTAQADRNRSTSTESDLIHLRKEFIRVFQKPLRILSPLLGGLLFVNLAVAGTPYKNKQIYGLHEHVHLHGLDVSLKAKLDTGATTSSLSAKNIERFKRGNAPWVRFELAYKEAPAQVYELPLARISKIKRRADDLDNEDDKSYTARPVVKILVQLGEREELIEVNLADRSQFLYPFLLGARGLKDLGAVVDPSLRYTAGKPALSRPVKHSGE